MSDLRADELMRLLIPEGEVEKYAKASGLSKSLLYQERREYGKADHQTGTRNTIDRLDIFTDLALSNSPHLVLLVGERYLNKYKHHFQPRQKVSVTDLLVELGEVSRECGEAVAALASRKSIKKCSVEVAQAKERLEHALAMVAALEECDD